MNPERIKKLSSEAVEITTKIKENTKRKKDVDPVIIGALIIRDSLTAVECKLSHLKATLEELTTYIKNRDKGRG